MVWASRGWPGHGTGGSRILGGRGEWGLGVQGGGGISGCRKEGDLGVQGEQGSPCSPPAPLPSVPAGAQGPITPVTRNIYLFKLPWQLQGFFFLPDSREVPGEPGWLSCSLLMSRCAPCVWHLAAGLCGEEAAPHPGGCSTSAGSAQFLEGNALAANWFCFASALGLSQRCPRTARDGAL